MLIEILFFCRCSIHHNQIVANKIDVDDLRKVSEQRAEHLMVSIRIYIRIVAYVKKRNVWGS